MKKKFVLLLASIMLLTLCACGGGGSEENPIESELAGVWMDQYIEEANGMQLLMLSYYSFEDGEAFGGVEIIDAHSEVCYARSTANGTYEIGESNIEITWNKIEHENEELALEPYAELPYTYKEGDFFHLFTGDGGAELIHQDSAE